MLNDISSNFPTQKKTDFLKNQTTQLNNKNNNSYAKKVVLASKGETGYFAQMDLDEDGILTLEEFSQYCEENGVSEEDKIKLLQTMNAAKIASEMAEKMDEKRTQEKEAENKKEVEDDKNIYARKGDKKYDEKMDENKDSKVTYSEYLKYCEKRMSENPKTDSSKETQNKDQKTKEALNSYSKTDTSDEPSSTEDISVEIEV